MKVLITGANGFLGKNLQLHLAERQDVQVVCFTRDEHIKVLPTLLQGIDFVFHLAGTNRPQDPQDFNADNVELTQALCQELGVYVKSTGKKPSVIYSSSIQAEGDSLYGASKLVAEQLLFSLARNSQVPVYVFRLPNVFGKWCKPNYNSVVATFCYNIAHSLPIQVNVPTAPVKLVYVDDVIAHFVQIMHCANPPVEWQGFESVSPRYCTTVGELAKQIQAFKDSRATLVTERVASGFVRALYSTYVSYLPVDSFSYAVPQYSDNRGMFVEMVKTIDSGQFSCFTAHPGITRGGHYHHSKTEKFLVIKGDALFKFRHMQTGQVYELSTSGNSPVVVETIPGWAHNITNTGATDMVVMVWANEVFDRSRSDTFISPT